MLKSYCKLNQSDFLLSGAVMTGLFLVVHVITLLALAFTHEHSSLLLSGTLLPVAGGLCMLVAALTAVLISFDLNQTLGCTRRRSLALVFGYLAAQYLLFAVFCWGFTALEHAVCPSLWKVLFHFDQLQFADSSTFAPGQLENVLFIEDFSLAWFWPLVILLGGLLLGVTVGVGIRRFGQKFAWVTWLIFILALFSSSRGPIHKPYFPILLAVAAVLLVPAFVWAVYELLHSPVNV